MITTVEWVFACIFPGQRRGVHLLPDQGGAFPEQQWLVVVVYAEVGEQDLVLVRSQCSLQHDFSKELQRVHITP